MSAACPFCGDDRGTMPHSFKPDDGLKPKWLHKRTCMTCGADGPVSSTKRGALTLWSNREAAGSSAVWRKQFEKITQ